MFTQFFQKDEPVDPLVQIEQLKQALATANNERLLISEENLKLRKAAKTDSDAKIQALEKELHQLRLKAKLKVTQMQKEIEQLTKQGSNPSISQSISQHSRHNTTELLSDTDELEYLRQDIKEANELIENLKAQLEEKNPQLVSLNETIEQNQTMIQSLQSDKEILQKELKYLQNQNVELLEQLSKLQETAPVDQSTGVSSVLDPGMISSLSQPENASESLAKVPLTLNENEVASPEAITSEETSSEQEHQAPHEMEKSDASEILHKTTESLHVDSELSKLESSAASLTTTSTEFPLNEQLKSALEAQEIKTTQAEKRANLLSSEVKNLKAKISNLTDKNQELISQAKKDQESIDSLKGKVENSAKKLKSMKEELDRANKSADDAYAVQKSHTDSLLIQLEELRAVQKNDESMKKKLSETTFTLEEQVKDLRVQLNNKNAELQAMEETVKGRINETEKSQSENEERLKKMKGLLIAANKKMLEYKEANATHVTELETERAKLAEFTEKENQWNEKFTQKEGKLLAEMNDARQQNTSANEESTRQLKETTQELESLRIEFQNYKVKAHAALQMSATSGLDGKINELENEKTNLEIKLGEKEIQHQRALEKIKALESEIRIRDEQIEVYQKQLSELEFNSREIIRLQQDLDTLQSQLVSEAKDHKEKLDLISQSKTNQLDEINQILKEKEIHFEQQLRSKDTDYRQILVDMKSLKDEFAKYKSETESNSQRTPILTTQTSQIFMEKSPLPTAVPQSSYEGGLLIRRSSSGPLSPAAESAISSFKQKELTIRIEQLSKLLTESEATIQRLVEQEKILKDELRQDDRMRRRENLNIEYLKNIVISFFEGRSKDKLIPVLAQVLQLTPEEQNRLKKAVSPSVFGIF